MSQYILRRLLIAVPSLLGISVVLFIVLALAPGDPVLGTGDQSRTSRPKSVPRFGRSSASTIRSIFATCTGSAPCCRATGAFPSSAGSNVGHADPAAPADHAVRDRLVAAAGAPDRAAGRRLRGDAALFAVRPDRQHACLHRLLAADLLHRPRCSSWSFRIKLDWLPFVYPLRHRGDRLAGCWEQIRQAIMPVAVLGLFQAASLDALRALRRARRDPPRLRHHRALQGPGRGARSSSSTCVRNALIPVVTLVALQMPAVFGGAIVTEQIFRIPGIGSLLITAILANDTPVIMAVTFVFAWPRDALQPHCGCSVWLARPSHLRFV